MGRTSQTDPFEPAFAGNVHSADGWRAVLEPVVPRHRDIVKRLYFRSDAAFANLEIYEFLEADGAGYTIRLPANRAQVIHRRQNHCLLPDYTKQGISAEYDSAQPGVFLLGNARHGWQP